MGKDKKDKKNKKEKKEKRRKLDDEDAGSVEGGDDGHGGVKPEDNDAVDGGTVDADDDDAVDVKNDDENVDGDNEANDAVEGGTSKRKRKRKRKRKTKGEGDDDEEVDEDDDDENNANDAVDHTVFVEGIPFDATPEDVKTFFVENGVEDVIELRLPTWQDSGRLRGFGHIKLGSTQSYDVALKEVNGKYMGKRYLNVQPANAPSNKVTHSVTSSSVAAPGDCKTLFLANLPYSATEDDIVKAIKKVVPKIALDENDASTSVRIAKNSVTHQSKGFGYLDLTDSNDVRQIMQSASKRPIKVGGRVVRLDYDTNGRIKGSYRADSGRLWSREQRDRGREGHHGGGGRNSSSSSAGQRRW